MRMAEDNGHGRSVAADRHGQDKLSEGAALGDARTMVRLAEGEPSRRRWWPPRLRRGGILLPKEHGAWAMLLVPFVIGFAAGGGWGTPVFLLLGIILSFFVARYPLVLWARTRFQRFPDRGLRTLIASAAHGTMLGGLLLVRHELWLMVPLGGIAAVLLVVHLWLVKLRKERTEASEFL